MADRTWFGTLTFKPEERHKVLSAARRYSDLQGEDFDSFDLAERSKRLERFASKELTRYLKRVRDAAGPFRYVAVSEAHKDGFPHYHLLVHEHATPLRHAVLTGKWQVGFSRMTLVTDPKVAGYVTKYISKDTLSRVRASVSYGTLGERNERSEV